MTLDCPATYPDSNSTNLYLIELATGAKQFLATLNPAYGKLEFLPDGRLFALTSCNLVQIDTDTWSTRTVDDCSTPSSGGGGLAYNPADGKLYATSSGTDDSLMTVDPASGARTVVARLGDWQIVSIAFADDGLLYGVDARQNLPGRLVRIDPRTGAVRVIGPTGRVDSGPLEFDPATKTLYMAQGGVLFAMNRQSGAATPVSLPGGGNFELPTVMSLAIPPTGPQAVATVSIDVALYRPWHNAAAPCDVDGNQTISPNDALAVINFINSRGGGPVEAESGGNLYDVSGDNFVSPIDALLVINLLNAATNGEGESESPDELPGELPDAAPANWPSAMAADAAFTQHGGRTTWLTEDELLALSWTGRRGRHSALPTATMRS